MTTTAGRRPRVGLLQVAVSLAALAGIAWWATRQRSPHLSLDDAALAWLSAGLLLYAVATLLRGERWHRLLRGSDADRGRGESYRLTTIGYMGNNTLPARAGDVMRVMMLGSPRRIVLGTVVAERVLDALALAVIFAFVVADRGVDFGPLPYLIAAGAAGAAILGLLWVAAPRSARLLQAREWARPAVGTMRGLLGARGLALLVVSLVVWLVEASVYLTVGAAAGIALGLTGALYVVALTNLSALVPAAPGYVGTFDAAVLLALGSLKLPALGYLLVLRFVLFVPITVVGLALLLARVSRRRR
ncbi:MAG TPA: lysylphosphatidylglycerol synthase transmembrane domain-containing protein [Gaiellaceae bacterium]